MAIAAGLIIVIGSFSIIVINNLWHPTTPNEQWATNNDGKNRQIADSEQPKNQAQEQLSKQVDGTAAAVGNKLRSRLR